MRKALSNSENVGSPMALEEGQGGERRGAHIITAQPINTISSPSEDIIPISAEDRVYRPPPGQWNDGLCDWYKNLFPTCYCALFACHGVWMLAQIAKKTKFLDKYFDGNKIFYLIVYI